MRGKARAPGIDMGGAKVPAAAPMAAATSTSAPMAATTATSAAFTSASASASAASTNAALGKRDICSAKWRANRNPERADTCGKSQDDKPADKLFADPAHDVFLPQKGISFGARQPHGQRRSHARVPPPPRP
jgi:hypothetical protein